MRGVGPAKKLQVVQRSRLQHGLRPTKRGLGAIRAAICLRGKLAAGLGVGGAPWHDVDLHLIPNARLPAQGGEGRKEVALPVDRRRRRRHHRGAAQG